MRTIGYWKELGRFATAEEEAAEVIAGIVPGFTYSFEGWACIKYLCAGTKTTAALGYALNRITGKTLGCWDMISPDGKWQYPEMFWDYIENQSYRPCQEFIDDAVCWFTAQQREEARKKYMETISGM